MQYIFVNFFFLIFAVHNFRQGLQLWLLAPSVPPPPPKKSIYATVQTGMVHTRSTFVVGRAVSVSLTTRLNAVSSFKNAWISTFTPRTPWTARFWVLSVTCKHTINYEGGHPVVYYQTLLTTILTYLNNIIPSWPEDGRLTAETCRQV